MFDSNGTSARYIVVFIPNMNKFITAIDMTELIGRRNFIGGYVSHHCSKGFYTY